MKSSYLSTVHWGLQTIIIGAKSEVLSRTREGWAEMGSGFGELNQSSPPPPLKIQRSSPRKGQLDIFWDNTMCREVHRQFCNHFCVFIQNYFN